jgi:hypothetical protein
VIRLISLAILVVVAIVLALGISLHESLASGAGESGPGTLGDPGTWLIALGLVGIVAGSLGSLFRRDGR